MSHQIFELDRRQFGLGMGALAGTAAIPTAALAKSSSMGKDAVVLGMTLEPPGLDPTAGAASAIAEVVLYNVFETLTKINADGTVSPLLAQSWELAPDLKSYTFKLRKDASFSNGVAFDSKIVKFSFDRAADDKSTNKDKRTFQNIQTIATPDAHTVVIVTKTIEPDFLFLMGQATAIMVEPSTVATNATQPVGTGPFVLGNWSKGASLVLNANPKYRAAAALKLTRVNFRFISDPAAQIASLLSGDVDAFPRVSAARSLGQFQKNPKFQVITAGSRAKTILAINNKKKPLDDVRVRRAIAAAIDRKAVISGAADGFGVPIGSHYVPGAFGFVDTTGVNPYDPEKAKKLLAEAGVKDLELTITLPPPPYARQGGEVVASMLNKVGIKTKLVNVEWAQWLKGTYGDKQYDLTIISHVEPFDLGNFAKPGYYWNYESAKFNDTFKKINESLSAKERAKWLGQAQQQIAADSVHAFLYQPQWITVANSRLKGLWKDMPIFVNDMSVVNWA
jgi:peptide/nickel transport system substrate-binding protein